MIRNLPEKMKTLGVLSLIRNLGVVAEEKRSEYQVLSINTYSKKNKLLTQAVLVMPDKMGQRLISHNGKKVGDNDLEITRTKECRFGKNCSNFGHGKSCKFYHKIREEMVINPVPDINKRSKMKKCWYYALPNSCPFGDNCKYLHPLKEDGNANGDEVTSGLPGKNC